MKRDYPLSQQFAVCILLASLLLQSCNSSILVKQEPIYHTQEPISQTNIQPLLGQGLTAQGGHLVTFREEGKQLVADVAMNIPQGFSKTYEGINVYIEQEAELATLPRLNAKAQERLIHLQLAQGSQHPKVVIYKGAGLMGGSNTDKRKGKEKPQDDEEPDGEQEQENDLARYPQLLSLATEGEAEAQFLLGKRAYESWKKEGQKEGKLIEMLLIY